MVVREQQLAAADDHVRDTLAVPFISAVSTFCFQHVRNTVPREGEVDVDVDGLASSLFSMLINEGGTLSEAEGGTQSAANVAGTGTGTQLAPLGTPARMSAPPANAAKSKAKRVRGRKSPGQEAPKEHFVLPSKEVVVSQRWARFACLSGCAHCAS